MRSYVYRVVIEPDDGAWHARVPELENQGAATWGKTREEAMANIQEVTRMVIESLLDDGETVPAGVLVAQEALVSVTV